MKINLNDFLLDLKTNVYVSPEYDEFQYSDGLNAEKNIFDTLSKVSDKSIFSEELRNSIIDWPSEYHFSFDRHNLLRHFQFKNTDRILELGCGCGALTRQLGETGASVYAVEGSYLRANCARLRCEELDNVKIFVGNFSNIEFINEFNYVLMIGVLEYSPKYFDGKNPLSQCISIVKKALKNDGKYILAIENRLGLKYFSGLGEDHIGKAYVGIQDLYKPKSVITLGKGEITKLLHENGFRSIEFQYPFPDYKIPKLILMENAFGSEKFSPSEIICRLNSRDYSNKTSPKFSEKLVWPVLEANNLIQDLSNSFLITCGFNSIKNNSNVLAVFYTTDRRLEYNTKTEFVEIEESNIKVNKAKLVDNNIQNETLVQILGTDSYYSGSNLDTVIDRLIFENDFQGYIEKLLMWIDFVVNNGLRSNFKDNIFLSKVKPDYIDCLPFNLLLSENSLSYIDREWEYLEDFSLSALLLRYLTHKKHEQITNRNIMGDEKYYVKLFKYLNINYNEEIYHDYEYLNKRMYNIVYPDKTSINFGNKNENQAVHKRSKLLKLLKKIKRKIKISYYRVSK